MGLPVQLVPSFTITICGGDFFGGSAASRTHNIRDPQGLSSFGRCDLAIRMEEALYPNRTHYEWRGICLPKEIDLENDSVRKKKG
jgi:hypothetical protein